MPAKKSTPPVEPVDSIVPPADLAVPPKRKNTPAKTKATSPAKPEKSVMAPKKLAVRKTMPAKKNPASLVESVESIVPPAEPVFPEPAPVATTPVPAAPEIPARAAPVPMAPYASNQPIPFGSVKPGMVQAVAIMTLINGILNILYGLSVTTVIVLGTFFIGIICAPVTILPVVLGIFEIIYAAKLIANPPQPVKPSQTIAILEIVAILSGNVISAVVGVLALVFYADTNVKAYFARLNGQA